MSPRRGCQSSSSYDMAKPHMIASYNSMTVLSSRFNPVGYDSPGLAPFPSDTEAVDWLHESSHPQIS